MNVLVTGVTGYIGGRLVPRLLDAGHPVRVLVRDPGRLEARPWGTRVEVVEGAVEDGETVAAAAQGIDAAYYLVQAMCAGPEGHRRDRVAAAAFARAAEGLPQVICLGMIPPGPRGRSLPPDLRNRLETGRILSSSLPTTELRVGPIIGSGSASFEMLRFLTERFPVAAAPPWTRNPIQPIAVRDVLSYLVAVLGRPDSLGVIEVGAEPLTFKEMMKEYARQKGIRRVIVPIPVQPPNLSPFWAGLVTPLPRCLAGLLVRGMSGPVLADTHRSRQLFPEIRPIPYAEALGLALLRINDRRVTTRWSDALGRRETPRIEEMEGVVKEVRNRLVAAPQDAVFRAVSSLGGDRGWLFWNWAWRLRGFMDKIVGGPGLRRGRRHPVELLPGDAVDFWRVEEVRPPRLLRLRAEMKVPGRAWLQWETREEDGHTRLTQAALFEPKGLFGWAYWVGSYPFHHFIFDGMIDAIGELAVAEEPEPHGLGPSR
jgi:uncharacterized protein YbjT (DUF2867 family)